MVKRADFMLALHGLRGAGPRAIRGIAKYLSDGTRGTRAARRAMGERADGRVLERR